MIVKKKEKASYGHVQDANEMRTRMEGKWKVVERNMIVKNHSRLERGEWERETLLVSRFFTYGMLLYLFPFVQ